MSTRGKSAAMLVPSQEETVGVTWVGPSPTQASPRGAPSDAASPPSVGPAPDSGLSCPASSLVDPSVEPPSRRPAAPLAPALPHAQIARASDETTHSHRMFAPPD